MKRTICILLCAVFCVAASAKDELGLKTVVIDAGHGGHDPGAVSLDKKNYEKTFTLDISRRLAAKIQDEYPDVKVVLTRNRDEYITLDGRAAAANKVSADLFISIHINSAANTSANGFSVHVLGQSSNKNRDLFAGNMDIVQRENSVIMLEDDYTTKYEGFDPSDPESYIFMLLMQNSNLNQSLDFAGIVGRNLAGGPIARDRGVSQDPFYVLWKTSMPAVLVELGFISNQADLTSLRDPEKRDDLARRLCNSFREYKTAYDRTVSMGTGAPAPVQEPEKPAQAPAAPAENAPVVDVAPGGNESAANAVAAEEAEVLYGVQIFAISKLLPENSREFMGYVPKIIQGPKLYKYILSVSDDLDKVKSQLSTIKNKYPDAFLVKIEGGNITRLN